jgi:TatD DNase family protein
VPLALLQLRPVIRAIRRKTAEANIAVQNMIDVGANLVNRVFDGDRRAVMERAAAAGVEACIVTGTCVRTSQAAARLCEADKTLWFTAGVHPHNAKGCHAGTLGALRKLAAHPRCVAIGECGLDFNRDFSPRPDQERWFAAQVELAESLGKPLFLHCRDAEPRFIEILNARRRSVPGVVHCFTGTSDALDTYLRMGLHIGITGWVADRRRGAPLAALLPRIPANRLLVETDCPYLTPSTVPNAPRRNEPAFLPSVVAAVAEARGQADADVAATTSANARQLFGLS